MQGAQTRPSNPAELRHAHGMVWDMVCHLYSGPLMRLLYRLAFGNWWRYRTARLKPRFRRKTHQRSWRVGRIIRLKTIRIVLVWIKKMLHMSSFSIVFWGGVTTNCNLVSCFHDNKLQFIFVDILPVHFFPLYYSHFKIPSNRRTVVNC